MMARIYTEYQTFLYNRALFGLKVYTEAELAVMHGAKKKRILKVHRNAQNVINLWKQSLVHEFTKPIFNLFYHSPLAKQLKEMDETDPDFDCTLTFKDLGLKKDDIVDKLIESKILPNNFMDLK